MAAYVIGLTAVWSQVANYRRGFVTCKSAAAFYWSEKSLGAEQVRDFHEELPAVIDECVRAGQQARRGRYQSSIDVLEIAVIADVDGSPWVHQIRNQEIGVDLFGRW